MLSAAVIAQSPLTTIFAGGNSGAVGGAVYFDLTVNVPLSITGLDMNLNSAATTAGTMEVWTLNPGTRSGNQTNAGLWTMVATGTVVAAGLGLPSFVTLSNPIALNPGTLGVTLVARTGVANAYTNGTGANQNYSTAELSLAAGEASNVPFTAGIFTPRVVNCSIHYSTSGGGVLATKSKYGIGGGEFASTYENFATPATFDLNGANIEFNETASGGWTIGAGTAMVSAAGAAALVLGDDSEVTQALSSGFAASVNVCSNGFISVGGSNGTGFTPAVATMLNNPMAGFYIHHDFNPGAAGSGSVKYQFIGGEDVITWDGVFDFAAATPNTFQFRLTGAPGARRVRISIVSLSGNGNGVLVAYSPAGASLDPGNTDISATASQTLGATDLALLDLDASARPVTGTSINLNTTNIRGGALAAVLALSFTQNLGGLDLGLIGAPGNRFYLGSIDVSVGLAFGGGTGTLGLSIPNNPAIVGGDLFVQTMTVVPGANALGIVTANGLKLHIGDI